MKSFFGICVLSALAAVGTTQPTHNSPHHDAGQTQHHPQSDYHMSQIDHRMSHPERHMSRPQHGFENWSTANAQAQSETTFISPEYPQYQAEDILRQPDMVTGRHHIVHPEPQPMNPQVELIPNPYQHSHYTPTRSHHIQNTGPIEVQPTYGWSPVYELPLPEAPVPEHHMDSFKEDHQLPNQFSASANAVAFSSNSVPVANNEPHPHLYKMISMPKADHGADYIMPVADHETRQPEVFQTSNVDALPDIVQKILAKYRNKPIEIKPEPIPDNNAPSHKEHKPEGHGRVHRPLKHKKHKGFIPLLRIPSTKVKAVPVAKTDTDKTYIITGRKPSTATKAPIRHKHKHSHKKILKPLFDPELLAKELDLLSKELWARSPDKTHEKDVPCDDNPIVTDAPTNSDDTDCDEGSNYPDKNEPKDKPKDKNHNKKHSHISADPEKDISDKKTQPSSYIELYDEKDDEDTDCDSASLEEAPEPCNDDNAPETEDKRKKHKPKPVDPKIENSDFKEKEVVQKIKVKKELKKKVEIIKEEEIEQSETKTYDGKQHPKRGDQKDADKDTDSDSASIDKTIEQPHTPKIIVPNKETRPTEPNTHVKPGDQKGADRDTDCESANSDEITEPCDDPETENGRKKHVPKPKTDDKQNNDPDKTHPKYKPPQHHHNKHARPYTPPNIVPKKDKPNTHVKPADADRDADYESANSDATTEPCDDPETENERKKHVRKPQTDDKQNNDPDATNPKNKLPQHHHYEHAQPYTPPNIVPKKDKPKTHVKPGDADKDTDYESTNPDKTTEACDDPETENKRKQHIPKPKTDDKQSKDPDETNPMNNPPQYHHNKHAQPYTPPNIVPKKDKLNTHVKPGDADKDTDYESTNPDKTTEACDDPETENKRKQHVPKQKTDDSQNNDTDATNPKNKLPQHHHYEHAQPYTPPNIVPKKDKPKTHVKPGDADKDTDYESTNPDKTTEACDDPETENGRKKHVPKPKTDDKQNNDPDKTHPKYKPPQHHHNKHARPYTPPNIVPKKDKPNTHVKPADADRDADYELANSDATTEPCDDPETENERKKHVPKPQTDDKQNNDPDATNPKNKLPQHHHYEHAQPYTPPNIVPKKDKPKTHVKPGDADKDTDYESTNPDKTTEACDDPETENKRKQHVPKPKTDDKQSKDPDETNPMNNPPQYHHNKHAQPYTPPNIVPKKDKLNTHVKPGDADKDTDYESANPDKTTEACDDPETENKRKQHVPKQKTDDSQNNDTDEIKPKNKPPQHHHNNYAQPYTPPNIIPKTDKLNTHVKPGDQKGKDRGSDCESGTSDESCDKDNAPEKDDKQIQHLGRPKTDNKINVNSKPVDNNKENIDTTTNKKVIEKKEEEIRKVEIKKKETTEQPEKNKQKIYEKRKPVEQYDSKSFSDIEDCESTESEETPKPSDETPDPGYNRELKEPQPISNKDNKVSKVLTKLKEIDVKKEESVKVEAKTKKSTKNFISSAAVDKPVEKSNENSDIDDYDSADSETDPNLDKTGSIKEKHDPKKEKPEKKLSVIEDCDSTESKESQKPSDKTPDPGYNRELKEPVPKSYKDNKVSKVLTKLKEIDVKKEESVKVEAKTKKSTKNLISSAAVDKPVEKSNENSDIDDYDSADSETDPNLDKTGSIKEKHDPKKEKPEKKLSVIEDCDSTESKESQKPSDKTPDPGYNRELKEPVPKSYKDNKVSKVLTKLKEIDVKKEESVKVEAKTKKSTKNLISFAAVDKPVEKSNENSDIDDYDSADSETDPNLDKTGSIKEKHDPKKEKPEKKLSVIEDCDSTESKESQKPSDKTPDPGYNRELKEPVPKSYKDNKVSKVLTKLKKIDIKKEETVQVEAKTKKSTKNVVSSAAVDKPVEKSNENSEIDDCDPADSETIKEKHDPKKDKTKEVNKKKVIKAKNKAEGKGEQLTSAEVHQILETTETDQPLSTVGFLFSLISHALQGSDSVKQMFEEPKVKNFMNNILPLFHENQKEGYVSDYAL